MEERMAKAGGRVACSSAAATRRVMRKLGLPGNISHRRPGPLHQSTASGSDRPSSSVIVSSACPAPFRVADRGVAFTERNQHGDRQPLEGHSRSRRGLFVGPD